MLTHFAVKGDAGSFGGQAVRMAVEEAQLVISEATLEELADVLARASLRYH